MPALLLAIPLEFTGAALPLKFDLSRVIALLGGIALIVLAWGRRRSIILPWYLSAAFYVLYAAAAVLSWLFTRSPGASSSLLAVLVYPAVAVLVMNLAQAAGDHSRAWTAFLVSGLVVCGIGLFLYVTHLSIWRPDPSGHFRVNSTFADPDIMVRVASMVACAAVLLYGSVTRRRGLAIAAALAAALVSPLTLSRLGLVLFVGSVAMGVVLAADRRRALALAAVALLAFGGSTATNPDTRDRAVNAFQSVVATADAALHPKPSTGGGTPSPPIPTTKKLANLLPLDEERRYLIAAGLQMFVDHPVEGVGFGGFQHALVTHYRQYLVPAIYRDTLSHTSFVTVLAEQGLIGEALLLAFLVQFVREIVRAGRRRRADGVWILLPAALLLIIFVDSQVEARLFTEPYLWVLMGLLYSAYRRAERHLWADDSEGRDTDRPDDALTVTFLTHYFPPEVGAPQARLSELAKRLVEHGVKVIVVTGMPNYPSGVVMQGYRDKWWMDEQINGATVLRTWVIPARNQGFFKRIVNHLSFCLSSLSAIERLGPVDVIFVESPPLLLGLSALIYSWATRAPFVFNVSDIWPQSAVELGALHNPFVIRLAEMLERYVYQRAARISVVTQGILDQLAARGVPREKLFLLTNAVDASTYQPAPPDRELATRLGLDGRKVFLYAGTHGMAQGLDVILETAKLTKDSNILYLLAGEGAEKDSLVAKARAEHIDNVVFLPNQPRSAMPALLNLAYATIIPLRRLEVFKSALPSKMFESMATGRPIVGAVWGEAARLIEEADCGVVVKPEDASSMCEAVLRLAAEPDTARRLGDNGRQYVVRNFERAAVAERFLNLLRQAKAAGQHRQKAGV